MVLFELGSAVVVGIGLEAKADAWAAVLFGLAASLVFLGSYAFLYAHYPKEPLTVFVSSIVGEKLGTVLAVLYTCYFMYIGARVLRDFSELVLLDLLKETPALVIPFCMMAVVAYSLYLGIEVIGRTGELAFIVTLLFSAGFLLLVYVSGIAKAENLQPVLENGLAPVIKAAFPRIVTFPFGESIVFLMFFCFADVSSRRTVVQTGIAAVIFSGLLLCFTTLTNTAVLGPYTAGQSRFPLLETLSRINMGNFIQRLDPLVIVILIVGGYFKIAVFTAASVLGFVSINPNKQPHPFIIPVSFMLVILSTIMADNLVEHLEFGIKVVPWMLHLPFQFGIPVLLCIILFLKKRLSKKEIQT
jgi:spore germination protein KB